MITIKSTININKNYKEYLEYLVSIKELNSITEGINLALEKYLKEKKKEMYEEKMAEAAKDPDFMERTVKSQKDFEELDNDLNKSLEEEEW